MDILDPSHGGYIAVPQQAGCFLVGSTPPSPAVSDSVFSATSDASSQSSVGDSPEDTCPQRPCQPAEPAPAPQNQHPRRTSTTKTPPSLPRQEERKVLFVNDLVDSATSLVSVIWPSTGTPVCNVGSKGQVLPLRRYIEETLRRSRTSYSTLQVALYYLILVKDHVTPDNIQSYEDNAERRAMRCGRRMFLSALILASKYLQDRNYSAKAWSKMSGLKTTEINSNERLFLSAVDWKLHISDDVFKRWTDIVLRFTAPPASAASCNALVFDSKAAWAQVIPLLTPQLDEPSIMTLQVTGDVSSPPPSSGILTPGATPPPATLSFSAASSPEDTTTPMTICPRYLEPKPDMLPPTPGLARMCRLPTPLMTPSICASTPAASACSSRRPSISMAMAQAQSNMISRMTLDGFATPGFPARSGSIRFPSVAPSTSTCLSPESMISDRTRWSRSSSISSFSMQASAPRHAPAARPATSHPRGVEVINLEVPTAGTADHPIVLDSPETICLDAAPASLRTKKRSCGTAFESAADEQLRADVQALLLQNEALDLTSYSCARVSPRLAAQPPAALHKARLPVPQADGRKRVCSSIEAASVPDVVIVGDVWQDVL